MSFALIVGHEWTVKQMTTDELITALREYANADEMPLWLVRNAMTEAADRLEELKPQESPCDNCQEWVCAGCKYAEHGEVKK